MISFKTALHKVLDNIQDYGNEYVDLMQSNNRILAETILADRDFPPFDRATKDGIAICFNGILSPDQTFKATGIAQAGSPQEVLEKNTECIEVMTGAMVPEHADTVVMYEHINAEHGTFSLLKPVTKGQNIHYKGSDVAISDVLLKPGIQITAAEIGVLASVGKSEVLVKKLPKIAVIATGNELVGVEEKPLPYQIRKSNSFTLKGLLIKESISADLYHLADNPDVLKKKLEVLITDYDVLLLSGGVSKGKFDFLPETFNTLGVEKIFHKVLQRPGKPFWFGKLKSKSTTIFSFPGNPVSTFVNYHVYFKPWLNKTLGIATTEFAVFLNEPIHNKTELTLFIGVIISKINGEMFAKMLKTTGSGDLIGLSKVDGFIQLSPKEELDEGKKLVPFIPTRRII
ncbi:molybdopterin molybdenumtransferase MoeA [Flagellimonas aquimarina]|uniref:Molybdopterin molybdenumtransferase n=1 Tax=Flagellimonas aquimarina TaxID=2201895 RepID=A0A316L1Q9_9FLAO|nr:molybdopterin molybdotransferase MoeA [Allomuricauda koreensis]PWL38925.1 molybdopterin molybdenumtransferase MoeA [Allomuricauda koreensis]